MLQIRYFDWTAPTGDTSVSDYLVGVVAGSEKQLIQAGSIDVVVQALMTSIAIALVFQHRRECPDEKPIKKAAMIFLAFTSITQLILTNIDFGQILAHRGQYAKVFTMDSLISAIGLFLGSISHLQLHLSFNCRTYYLCGRNQRLAGGLGVLIISSFVLSIVSFVFAVGFPRYNGATTPAEIQTDLASLQSKMNRLHLVQKLHISFTLLTDLLITATISKALWSCRSGFRQTNSLVKRLFVEFIGRMVPPIVLLVVHAALLFSGVGMSSWLRVTSGLQTPVCLYTIVTVLLLRVRKSSRYAFPETRQYQEKSGGSGAMLYNTSIGSTVARASEVA